MPVNPEAETEHEDDKEAVAGSGSDEGEILSSDEEGNVKAGDVPTPSLNYDIPKVTVPRSFLDSPTKPLPIVKKNEKSKEPPKKMTVLERLKAMKFASQQAQSKVNVFAAPALTTAPKKDEKEASDGELPSEDEADYQQQQRVRKGQRSGGFYDYDNPPSPSQQDQFQSNKQQHRSPRGNRQRQFRNDRFEERARSPPIPPMMMPPPAPIIDLATRVNDLTVEWYDLETATKEELTKFIIELREKETDLLKTLNEHDQEIGKLQAELVQEQNSLKGIDDENKAIQTERMQRKVQQTAAAAIAAFVNHQDNEQTKDENATESLADLRDEPPPIQNGEAHIWGLRPSAADESNTNTEMQAAVAKATKTVDMRFTSHVGFEPPPVNTEPNLLVPPPVISAAPVIFDDKPSDAPFAPTDEARVSAGGHSPTPDLSAPPPPISDKSDVDWSMWMEPRTSTSSSTPPSPFNAVLNHVRSLVRPPPAAPTLTAPPNVPFIRGPPPRLPAGLPPPPGWPPGTGPPRPQRAASPGRAAAPAHIRPLNVAPPTVVPPSINKPPPTVPSIINKPPPTVVPVINKPPPVLSAPPPKLDVPPPVISTVSTFNINTPPPSIVARAESGEPLSKFPKKASIIGGLFGASASPDKKSDSDIEVLSPQKSATAPPAAAIKPTSLPNVPGIELFLMDCKSDSSPSPDKQPFTQASSSPQPFAQAESTSIQPENTVDTSNELTKQIQPISSSTAPSHVPNEPEPSTTLPDQPVTSATDVPQPSTDTMSPQTNQPPESSIQIDPVVVSQPAVSTHSAVTVPSGCDTTDHVPTKSEDHEMEDLSQQCNTHVAAPPKSGFNVADILQSNNHNNDATSKGNESDKDDDKTQL